MTSFSIHILPAIFHYLLRWEPTMRPSADESLELLDLQDFLVYPLVLYLAWQSFYLFVQFNYIDRVTAQLFILTVSLLR